MNNSNRVCSQLCSSRKASKRFDVSTFGHFASFVYSFVRPSSRLPVRRFLQRMCFGYLSSSPSALSPVGFRSLCLSWEHKSIICDSYFSLLFSFSSFSSFSSILLVFYFCRIHCISLSLSLRFDHSESGAPLPTPRALLLNSSPTHIAFAGFFFCLGIFFYGIFQRSHKQMQQPSCSQPIVFHHLFLFLSPSALWFGGHFLFHVLFYSGNLSSIRLSRIFIFSRLS